MDVVNSNNQETGPNELAERRLRSKTALKWAALFLGELRDGLTMINMQSAFLIVSKGYSEKQVGILFFVFGMSQFLFQVRIQIVLEASSSLFQNLYTSKA